MFIPVYYLDFENIIQELEKVNDFNAKLVAEEMKKILSQG